MWHKLISIHGQNPIENVCVLQNKMCFLKREGDSISSYLNKIEMITKLSSELIIKMVNTIIVKEIYMILPHGFTSQF
jgi:hypothetical protein